METPTDANGVTWEQFASELFEFERCSECNGDMDNHTACIGPFGLWFAMCKSYQWGDMKHPGTVTKATE